MGEIAALRLTLVGVAALMALFAAEYIAATRNGTMGGTSLMAWDIYALQSRWLYRGWRVAALTVLFQPPAFAALLVVRVALAACAVLLAPTALAPLPLALLLALTLVVNLRHIHGRDGADDLTTVLLGGLLTYTLAGGETPLRWVGLGFVMAQVTLSYFVSGVAKLVSAEWRGGDAIVGVLATHIYGLPSLVPWLRDERVRRAICWATILWETSFPLYWAIPAPWCAVWLVAGVLFHLGVAVVMGLNTFLVAFLSAYPLLALPRYAGQ